MESYKGLIGIIPFAMLFLLLVMTRLKSYVSSFVTLIVTSAIAILIWHAPLSVIGYGVIEGLVIAAVPIIWIIFAAVLAFVLGTESGAIEIIKKTLMGITPNREVQAVIIAFSLGAFFESVAGFGTAVAIPAAILITLGFDPVRAAVITLVANSVPVAFGGLGLPIVVLSRITELNLAVLSHYVAIQLAPFALFVPLALLVLARGSFKGISKSIPDVLIIGFLFSATMLMIALFAGPELAALAGSLVSVGGYILYRKIITKKWPVMPKGVLTAFSTYIILLAIVLATRLPKIPALAQYPFTLNIKIGVHSVPIDWATTPGTILFVSAIIGALIQKLSFRRISVSLWVTAKKIVPGALTILCIVPLAKVAGYSGIIESVALAISGTVGRFFPLIAPSLGALGTFVTGSDTSSNILLGELQKKSAIATGYSPEWISAANTSGATAGKMISPQTIAIASATVDIADERALIRGTIWICAGYCIILGVYVSIAALFIA